jgi:hypothetical protein
MAICPFLCLVRSSTGGQLAAPWTTSRPIWAADREMTGNFSALSAAAAAAAAAAANDRSVAGGSFKSIPLGSQWISACPGPRGLPLKAHPARSAVHSNAEAQGCGWLKDERPNHVHV